MELKGIGVWFNSPSKNVYICAIKTVTASSVFSFKNYSRH